MILTDSIANPRSFPVNDAVTVEETYPYLLRNIYPDAIFWQLSCGYMTTGNLVDQAIGFLNEWEPDFIIIHAGINDCRPEAFTEFQKLIIDNISGRLFNYLKKHIYNPKFIKKRKKYRVSKQEFKKTLKKIKLIFDSSTILFIEICANNGYESARPGITERMKEYNQIASEIYGENMINVDELIKLNRGFNEDNLHLNKCGHEIITNKLVDKISHLLEKDTSIN